jgi:hypothetical protein
MINRKQARGQQPRESRDSRELIERVNEIRNSTRPQQLRDKLRQVSQVYDEFCRLADEGEDFRNQARTVGAQMQREQLRHACTDASAPIRQHRSVEEDFCAAANSTGKRLRGR